MAKRKRTHAETPKDVVPQRLVLIVGVLLLVIECALLPGLTSPFRLPKMALLTGVVAALAGVALANQVYRTGRVWPRSKIALCLLTYPALLAISTFWSALPRWALTAALVSLGIVLTTLWLSTFSFRQRHTLVRFAASGVTVSSFVAALQFFDSSPFAVAAKGRSSLTGLSGNPSDLAMAAVLLLPLLLFGGGDAVRNRKPDWVFAGILSVAVLSTQSMTGVAALLAFWLVVLIGYRHSRQAWIMAAGSFLVLLVIAGSTGVVQRTQDIVGRVSQGNVYDALSARTDGWSAGLEMLRNSPVLGVGAGNYTHAYYPARLASLERSNSKSDRTELSTHFEWAH
ncbi:MAG: O-antigen ligase family protein, partial [bacterium]|nr:O-antigen ligase family protein [bacterium]